MHPKEQEKQEPKVRVLLGKQCQLPSFFKLEVLTAGLGCAGSEFPSPAGVRPCGVLPEGSQDRLGRWEAVGGFQGGAGFGKGDFCGPVLPLIRCQVQDGGR